MNNKYSHIKVPKITPKAAYKKMQQEEIFIVDVRPKKFPKGPNFIIGSHHFPLLMLLENINQLPKDRPIIITDWAMRQSLLAAKYLLANDFKVLGVLKGGLERWEEEDYPFENRSKQNKNPPE